MKLFDSKKGLLLAGIILGAGIALLAYFGNPKNMAICTACFIRDIAGSMKFHQAAPVQYFRPEIPGIMLGALAAGLLNKEFKPKAGSSPAIRFLGGIMLMIFSLVFLGCTMRMVIRMASGDISAYVGLVGFIFGVATGVWFLKKGFSLGKAQPVKTADGYVLPGLLAFFMILSLVVPTLFVTSLEGPGSMHAPVLLSLAIGLLFGYFAQQSRLCFSGSVRNVFMAKDYSLLIMILGMFGVLVIYNLITGDFAFVAFGPIAHAENLWNILAMYGVGLAGVLFNGCPVRQLVLAGQGDVDGVITVLGMFTGAALAHNFGLASAAAAVATDTAAAVAGGPSLNGQIAVIASLLLLFIIGFWGSQKVTIAAVDKVAIEV